MADSEVIVHFLHVIAHNFLSENWGLGREPCTAHGGGRAAKDDEDSAKDGLERHWDQPRTAEPAG